MPPVLKLRSVISEMMIVMERSMKMCVGFVQVKQMDGFTAQVIGESVWASQISVMKSEKGHARSKCVERERSPSKMRQRTAIARQMVSS